LAKVLGSSVEKPVTALSDAGFLVVVAAGEVVAVDAGAAGVDVVAAVVEAAAAVVLGAGEDIVFLLFKLETLPQELIPRVIQRTEAETFRSLHSPPTVNGFAAE
jgi:hypothetical protein